MVLPRVAYPTATNDDTTAGTGLLPRDFLTCYGFAALREAIVTRRAETPSLPLAGFARLGEWSAESAVRPSPDSRPGEARPSDDRDYLAELVKIVSWKYSTF